MGWDWVKKGQVRSGRVGKGKDWAGLGALSLLFFFFFSLPRSEFQVAVQKVGSTSRNRVFWEPALLHCPKTAPCER